MEKIALIPLHFWLLFAIPIIGSAITYRLVRHRRFELVVALLIPPFVGELVFVYATLQGGAQISAFATASLWRAVLYLYPFALIPLGLWSPFVGLLAWLVLERRIPQDPRTVVNYLPLAAVLGAIVGAGLLGGFYGSLRILDLSDQNPALWALIGAASGLTGGVIVGLFFCLESRRRGVRHAAI